MNGTKFAGAAFYAVMAALALLTPFWLGSNYLLGMINTSFGFAICVVGLWIILGLTGQLSLAQAGFFAVGAYTTAILTVMHGWPWYLGILAAMATSAAAGFCIGAPTLKLSGRYLTITTMGFSIIMEQIARNWMEVTNGPDGIGNIPDPSFFGVSLDTNRAIFYFAFGMLALVVLFARQLQRSEFGLTLKMVRDDDLAAQACGVNLAFAKTVAFMIGGMLGGLGGAVYAHVMNYISPGEFSYSQSLIFLVMLVVGGYRSLGGAVAGAMLITILPEVLRGVKSWQMVIFGLAVVLIVRFFPGGIAQLFGHARRRLAALAERR